MWEWFEFETSGLGWVEVGWGFGCLEFDRVWLEAELRWVRQVPRLGLQKTWCNIHGVAAPGRREYVA